MVERLAVNEDVAGSNPAFPATFFLSIKNYTKPMLSFL